VTAPSLRAELARAIRRVNAAYNKLPESERPDVTWGEIDDRLEAAVAGDDRDLALAEIAHWRDRHLAMFEGAAT
jgi:hypothetical protein